MMRISLGQKEDDWLPLTLPWQLLNRLWVEVMQVKEHPSNLLLIINHKWRHQHLRRYVSTCFYNNEYITDCHYVTLHYRSLLLTLYYNIRISQNKEGILPVATLSIAIYVSSKYRSRRDVARGVDVAVGIINLN